MSPLIKVRKSSRILAVCGSSGANPNTCFTITLNVNCSTWREEEGGGVRRYIILRERKENLKEKSSIN